MVAQIVTKTISKTLAVGSIFAFRHATDSDLHTRNGELVNRFVIIRQGEPSLGTPFHRVIACDTRGVPLRDERPFDINNVDVNIFAAVDPDKLASYATL